MNAVIACGGTGGHLFPGIAVAEVLRERGHEVLLFVSEKEIDSLALSTRSQFRFEKLPTVGFPSLYSPKIFGFIRRFTESLSRCRSIYQKFKPQVILGMGGFTSTAPILAGRMRGISTLIHESNAVPGKANRLAARMVRAVLLGFKECAAFFPKVRTELTGTPITYGPAPVQTVGGVTYGPGPAGTYIAPGEIGPSILRPDGTVFWTGAAPSGQTAHTAIYHPGASAAVAGSWTAGPDIPNGDNADDSSAALLVNGNVLLAGKSDGLYEFNGTSLTRTVAPPSSAVGTFLLPLPSGQVLVLTPGQTIRARLYTPTGGPQAGWAPTITSVPTALTRGQTYSLTGTQLNGLSEAAAYGDEFSSPTNYPLVRITNTATGHVVYARTHGHTLGVATGGALVTTNFDVPAGAETGASTLVVVANGIASASQNVTVS